MIDHEKGSSKKNKTHGNHRKRGDSSQFEFYLELVVEWDYKQLQVFHYVHIERILKSHHSSTVELSKKNHICGLVRLILCLSDLIQHKYLSNEDEIDHELEIANNQENIVLKTFMF